MIPEGFIGAALGCEFDYPRMANEILSCREHFAHTPPHQRLVDRALAGDIPFMSESEERYRATDTLAGGAIRTNRLRGASMFYLRNSCDGDVRRDPRFFVTKVLNHESWYWRPDLEARIAYTIGCIESLPYRTLGLVRVFVYENTFMPTHRDTEPERGYDRSRAVGLSVIPATGGVGMLIWDDAARRVRELEGHCLLFDDSRWHGVPMTRGTRITLRIFGDLDHAQLRGRFAEP